MLFAGLGSCGLADQPRYQRPDTLPGARYWRISTARTSTLGICSLRNSTSRCKLAGISSDKHQPDPPVPQVSRSSPPERAGHVFRVAFRGIQLADQPFESTGRVIAFEPGAELLVCPER